MRRKDREKPYEVLKAELEELVKKGKLTKRGMDITLNCKRRGGWNRRSDSFKKE